MTTVLEGINEKTKRANESIRNLDGEINVFFDKCLYPIIPHEDGEMRKEVIDYHLNRPIPLRFNVLCGEIVHHLRSCLDHIAWGLSSQAKRRSDPTGIGFPIFDKEPVGKNELTRYDRKVEGLPGGIKAVVKRLQPYQRTDPLDDPLSIIHKMDKLDKHRELVIVFPGIFVKPGPVTLRAFMDYFQAKTEATLSNFKSAMKVDGQPLPQVSFREFGKREYYPVIPGLQELSDSVVIVVSEFERFFKRKRS